MKYIIMLTIVIGLALADVLTGIIKAYVNNDISSSKMRKGGLNKIGEIIVMATACGLEIGIKLLGQYYDTTDTENGLVATKLAEISGTVAAIAIFTCIVFMELISLLENYLEANPDATWARRIVKRLRAFKNKEDDEQTPKAEDYEGE